jgi:hypothetical protein
MASTGQHRYVVVLLRIFRELGDRIDYHFYKFGGGSAEPGQQFLQTRVSKLLSFARSRFRNTVRVGEKNITAVQRRPSNFVICPSKDSNYGTGSRQFLLDAVRAAGESAKKQEELR